MQLARKELILAQLFSTYATKKKQNRHTAEALPSNIL
jgi:hypothetical protein